MKNLYKISLGLIALFILSCSQNEGPVPADMIDDWQDISQDKNKVRIHEDGVYAFIGYTNYSIINNDTLLLGRETYIREEGDEDIYGCWKLNIDDVEWEILCFKTDYTYTSEWNDGDLLNGYFDFSSDVLKTIEARGMIECKQDSIYTSYYNGYNFAGTYTINNDTLTIMYSEGTTVFKRINDME